MSTLMKRIRNRKVTDGRTRVIESAAQDAPSAAVRRELLDMTSR